MSCSVHAYAQADYRCDGCGRSLCGQCVRPSHRLILCALCGELAVPLRQGGARTSTELKRKTQRAGGRYGFLQAFGYALRGTGGYLFWVYGIITVILTLLQRFFASGLSLVGFLITLGVSIVIGLLIPRLLLMVVKTTADGDNEVPDWPDFAFLERLADSIFMSLSMIIAAIPGLLLGVVGCGSAFLTTGWISGGESFSSPDFSSIGPACAIWLGLGAVISFLLWVPMFGSMAVYDRKSLVFYLHKHFRALFVDPLQLVAILGLAGLVVTLDIAVPIALVRLTGSLFLGEVVGIFLNLYGWLTVTHFIGLYFRWNFEELERVYFGSYSGS